MEIIATGVIAAADCSCCLLDGHDKFESTGDRLDDRLDQESGTGLKDQNGGPVYWRFSKGFVTGGAYFVHTVAIQGLFNQAHTVSTELRFHCVGGYFATNSCFSVLHWMSVWLHCKSLQAGDVIALIGSLRRQTKVPVVPVGRK